MSWTLLAQADTSDPNWSWLFRGLVFSAGWWSWP
jgi:hypothetical protein